MRCTLFCTATISILTAACKPPPTVYPPAPPRYYTMTADMVQAPVSGALPRQSDILAKDAPKLLAPGKTIAFLPPDSCATESVAPTGAQGDNNSILMKCGALLAGLEAEVAKAGYSVVSWQALKTAGSTASNQERARSLDVDVLLEVNQLGQQEREAGERQLSNLAFGQMHSAADERSVNVPRSVADRCVGRTKPMDRNEVEFLATVNLKAVDVKSGRALWLYQNSVAELSGEETVQSVFFFKADGTRPAPPEAKVTALSVIGGVSLGLGLFQMFIGGLLLGAAGESAEGPAKGSLIVGSAMTIGGIVMLVLGQPKKTSDADVPEATYPAAGEVLCVANPVTPEWLSGADDAAGTATEEASASFSYGAKRDAARDRDVERARRLAQKITLDFVTALKAVAAGG
jgi:hypothetical protein